MIDHNIPFYNMILKCEKYPMTEIELPQGYSFRNYHAGDEKEWAKLEHEIGDFNSVQEAEKYFKTTYSDIKELQKRCVFLLNENSEIVGSCIAWKDKKDEKDVASLHWLIVSPNYQGKKLGKALFQKTMNLFRELNELPVYIHTQPWSYVAILLYINNGFKIQKTDTFADYTNEYNKALTVMKNILTEKQYSELQKNAED